MQLTRIHDRQSGFTLLEVLVAVIILGVGLLGLASLQAVSLWSNQSSHMRTQSTNLAYEMVDRMRSNRQAALGGAYEDFDNRSDPATCMTEEETLGGDVATQDLDAWANALACTLPLGRGSIERVDGQFRITVEWDIPDRLAEDADADEATETFVMLTAL